MSEKSAPFSRNRESAFATHCHKCVVASSVSDSTRRERSSFSASVKLCPSGSSEATLSATLRSEAATVSPGASLVAMARSALAV